MDSAAEPTRYAFDYPDETGYPGGKCALSQNQVVLIDEVIDGPHAPAFEFYMINDEKAGVYGAMLGSLEVAGLTYNATGDDRLVLMAVSVYPEFRAKGLATELIGRVLDDVRTHGKTVTILCPIVRTFIEHNRDYADLVSLNHPGVTRRSR